MISARGISRSFGAGVALAPVDLDVAAGGSLAVLGPNGAGKTSLLEILATAARPDAGQLELFGLDPWRHRSEVRRRIGYLAHRPALYPALTALENLEFFARLYGRGRPAAETALERAGLARLAGRPAAELSRGLQQRLDIARSLVNEPELWILDEPDASLDEDGRALLGMLAEGRTLVLATHDLQLARRLCRTQLVLRDGRVERPAISAVAR